MRDRGSVTGSQSATAVRVQRACQSRSFVERAVFLGISGVTDFRFAAHPEVTIDDSVRPSQVLSLT